VQITLAGSIGKERIRPQQNTDVERAAALLHPRIMEKASGKGDRSMIKNFALLIIAFAMLSFSPFGRAQNQGLTIDSTIAVVRANMQADRTAFITTGMNFNDKEGTAFWPIYQQYEYERSKLDDRRASRVRHEPELWCGLG
jgi:hypothetical protein